MPDDDHLLSAHTWIAEIGLPEAREIVLASDVFDPAYYRASYPDLWDEPDPIEHFLTFGIDEDRRPSLWFDSADYLDLNPDVASANILPLLHYVLFGRDEDRPGTKEIDAVMSSGLFDADYYLAKYPDVASFGKAPLHHYMLFGAYENRQPSAAFDIDAFFMTFPEVRPTECNPILYQLHVDALA